MKMKRVVWTIAVLISFLSIFAAEPKISPGEQLYYYYSIGTGTYNKINPKLAEDTTNLNRLDKMVSGAYLTPAQHTEFQNALASAGESLAQPKLFKVDASGNVLEYKAGLLGIGEVKWRKSSVTQEDIAGKTTALVTFPPGSATGICGTGTGA